jgi:hypothetical protein
MVLLDLRKAPVLSSLETLPLMDKPVVMSVTETIIHAQQSGPQKPVNVVGFQHQVLLLTAVANAVST